MYIVYKCLSFATFLFVCTWYEYTTPQGKSQGQSQGQNIWTIWRWRYETPKTNMQTDNHEILLQNVFYLEKNEKNIMFRLQQTKITHSKPTFFIMIENLLMFTEFTL